jgi:shikimate dehydrogenase
LDIAGGPLYNARVPEPFATPIHATTRTCAVCEMIYRRTEKPVPRAAQAAGCRIANGLGMLLHQGAKALELWTGREAPIDVMREALRWNIYG